jgi:hypothetical protein
MDLGERKNPYSVSDPPGTPQRRVSARQENAAGGLFQLPDSEYSTQHRRYRMITTRMTRPQRRVLSLFLLVTLAGCATLPSTSVITNIPSERLSRHTYTNPDGGYTVTLPHLQSGARIEELQASIDKHGLRMSDDSGNAYRILRVDNTHNHFTLEQISNESKVGELFRENRYVESDHGKELRLVGLKKEGSPLVSHTQEKDGVVTRKNDLYKADSIFMRGIYVYEVSAGVTASQGQSEDALFDEAKRNLEEFLKGLKVK